MGFKTFCFQNNYLKSNLTTTINNSTDPQLTRLKITFRTIMAS